MDKIKALEGASASHKTGRARMLSEPEGLAVIKAYRRGITERAIMEVLGIKGSTSIRSSLGTWALNHCKCGEGK